jgi:chemotaxis protein MotB
MTGMPNEGEEDTRQHELVIIRRRSDGDEAPHKGGVWKIAHADFMTALMAFFLVMWLITATDDKTITGVANYFNPLRLSDEVTRPKGVFSMERSGDSTTGEDQKSAKKKNEKKGKASPAPSAAAEESMLKNPYPVLAQLAARAGGDKQGLAKSDYGKGGQYRSGEAFRDPFDPEFEHATGRDAGGGGKEAGVESAAANKGTPEEQRERLRADIDEAIKSAGLSRIPGIEVRTTPEGLLISITDKADFEMFGIASARPKPELVVLMENIGAVLAGRNERLVIRGHTDGRPFRSDEYDNWRLSTARAHMAHYMLLRSGIPDKRVSRVEGHADHDLKNAKDPYAAANRRIDILLEKVKR